MSAPQYNRIKSSSTEDAKTTLDKNTTLIANSLSGIIRNPLVNGNYVTSVSLAPGQTTIVSHGLGHRYTDFFVCLKGLQVQVDVFEQVSPDTSQFLALTSNAPVTLNLFIF